MSRFPHNPSSRNRVASINRFGYELATKKIAEALLAGRPPHDPALADDIARQSGLAIGEVRALLLETASVQAGRAR